MSNDAAILGRLLRMVSGECRVCGCHGDSCKLASGERCMWTDKLRTLCSNPACQMAACKSRRKHKWDQKRAERESGAHGPRKRSTTRRKTKRRAA